MKLLQQAERSQLSGTLTANTLQMNDFQFPDSFSPPNLTPEIPHSGETFISQTGMGLLGIDLEFKVNALRFGKTDLGAMALRSKLKNGLFRITK